ncbi:hypothetical protein N0V84_011455 [Fusarium piperis]|uniref:Uncharacterized protein n=1 Tax=Fusarium piperis TaxID=1435070 RepID=A0A9W8TDJ3_9HYPO|nr:hypothetical protein N0V84_011455 [Fusarium piperis]
MSGTRSGQETPGPSTGSFGTYQYSMPVPEPRQRQRTHEPTWNKLTENVPKTEADWQAARRRHDFDSAERIPDTLARLLDPLEKSNLHKIIFLAGCNVDSYRAGRAPVYDVLRAYLGKPTLSEITMDSR